MKFATSFKQTVGESIPYEVVKVQPWGAGGQGAAAALWCAREAGAQSLTLALPELPTQPLRAGNVTGGGWDTKQTEQSMPGCSGQYEFTNELLSVETLLVRTASVLSNLLEGRWAEVDTSDAAARRCSR